MRGGISDAGRGFLGMNGVEGNFDYLLLGLMEIMNNRNLKVLDPSHTMMMTTLIKERNMYIAITPLESKSLTYIQPRMNLSNVDQVRLRNLRKGYEGERKLYMMPEKPLSKLLDPHRPTTQTASDPISN